MPPWRPRAKRSGLEQTANGSLAAWHPAVPGRAPEKNQEPPLHHVFGIHTSPQAPGYSGLRQTTQWKNDIATADVDRVADYASAEKIRQKSSADALLTYVQAAWPAWLTYAKPQYAAAATWFGQVWHDYADYQRAIAAAATAQIAAPAAPRIQYATGVATTWKKYNVTMAGIYVNRNNAAHAWHVAYVSSQPASDFAYIEPTENQSWWNSAWSGIVSFGTNLVVAVGLTVAGMALACYMPVAGAVLAVGGLVLLAANITAAAMTRYADGQSWGNRFSGGSATPRL